MAKQFAVHVPVWSGDSHAGTYGSLREAIIQAQYLLKDNPIRMRVDVIEEVTINLPLGWKLTRDRKVHMEVVNG